MCSQGRSSHLHSDRSPIKQFCFMNLSQASCSDGFVVKGFEKLLWGFVEIFLEESIHLSEGQTILREFQSVLPRSTHRPCLCYSSHLFVPPVQGLVFQYLQSADVLRREEVVEGTQTLAEFDVYPTVP